MAVTDDILNIGVIGLSVGVALYAMDKGMKMFGHASSAGSKWFK